MKNLSVALNKNTELVGTVIVMAGSLVGNFFSYLLQFFLARFLSVENYGVFNSLLAISNLISVPAAVLGTSLVKTVAELLAKQDFSSLTSLFKKLIFYTFIISIGVFTILSLLSGFISNYLNINDSKIVILFALSLVFGFINIVPFSFLQGLLRYKAFSFYVSLSNLLRLLIPALLVYLSFELHGVFVGMTVAGVLSLIAAFILLNKNFRKNSYTNVNVYFKDILFFSVPVLFVNLGLILLSNMDMILVKRYFDPTLAGYYAGAVTVGKILLFGGGTVGLIMFPKISALYAAGKSLTKDLINFGILQVLFILIGLVVFAGFPAFVTTLLFGSRFAHSITLLPKFSLFIGLYLLVNFLVLFFLAVDKTKVYLLILPCVLLQFILLHIFHSSLDVVLNINIISVSLLLTLLFVYLLRSRFFLKHAL